MDVYVKKKVRVNVATIFINLKVRDEFGCAIKTNDGQEIFSYEGYVPSWMPGEHYGDYVELEIDIDTGQILNWGKNIHRLSEWIEEQQSTD